MAKIIEFPSKKIKFSNHLRKELDKRFADMPVLAECLEKAFTDIHNIASSSAIKSFCLEIPDQPTQQQIEVIENSISEILENHNNIVRSLLEKIARNESEICLLKHHLNKYTS